LRSEVRKNEQTLLGLTAGYKSVSLSKEVGADKDLLHTGNFNMISILGALVIAFGGLFGYVSPSPPPNLTT
jgi:hypothetical protein